MRDKEGRMDIEGRALGTRGDVLRKVSDRYLGISRER